MERTMLTSSPLPSQPSPSVVPTLSINQSSIVKTVDHQIVINPNLSPANKQVMSRPSQSIDSHPGSHTSLPDLDLDSSSHQSTTQTTNHTLNSLKSTPKGRASPSPAINFPPPSLHANSQSAQHENEYASADDEDEHDVHSISQSKVTVEDEANLKHGLSASHANGTNVSTQTTPSAHQSNDHTDNQSAANHIELPPTSNLNRSSSLLHLRGTKKKLVLGMVGLPARGKSYIAQKIARYLNWCQYNCKVFNIGEYRRKLYGAHQSADYFDSQNPIGVVQREECAKRALHDMFQFFTQSENEGQAAVFDGTNSTVERRKMVQDYLAKYAPLNGLQVELIWIESIVYDQSIVTENIVSNKLSSPDYDHMTASEACADFQARIANYERLYETLPEVCDASYVKIIDQGRQIHTNKIVGYLMSKIVFFLMNLRVNRAPIFISRHGESQHNVLGLIGGDSALSPAGVQYGKALATFIETDEEFAGAQQSTSNQLTIWTSTMKRTIQTASHFRLPIVQWRALIEIQVGICDNMSYEEIADKYPAEAEARKKDKLHYRYPQGESYLDVIQRLEPVILELERMQTPVLLIVHRAVARCLLAYFLDLDPQQIPHLEVPLHTVMKLQPKAYRCEITQYSFPIPSVDLPVTKGT